VRQGQQNRRGRGRNRKSHQNPLARSFESNGPDVKIRGTPAHIAEKYLSLARDAQSSGDPVLAENYLQHAEHYNRIIMAYREQLQQPHDMANGNGQRMRGPGDDLGEDFGDEEGDEVIDDGFQPLPPQAQPMPQAPRQHTPYEGNRHDRPYRRDHGGFRNRNDRDRGDRMDRDRGDRDRGDRGGDRPQAEGRPPPPERQQESVEAGGGEPRRRERFQQAPQHEQPEFLRRPVRRSRSENAEPAPAPAKEEPRD
jgi:hypothetical protein